MAMKNVMVKDVHSEMEWKPFYEIANLTKKITNSLNMLTP